VSGTSCTLRSYLWCGGNWPATGLVKMSRYLWYCFRTCSSVVGSSLVVVVIVVLASTGLGVLVESLTLRIRALACSLVSLVSAFLPSSRRSARKLRTSMMVVQMAGGGLSW
jgi:hypothetical protein